MENAKIFKALQDLEREVQDLKRKFYLDRVDGENNPCCEVFLTEKSYGHPSGLTLDVSSACSSSVESKPKLAVGQVWKTRNGETTKIIDFFEGAACPWMDSEGNTYTDYGLYSVAMYDLVELISDSPAECSQSDTKPSIPKPLTKEPLMGETYYTLSPGLSHSVWYECEWCDTVADKATFDKGLAFATGNEASEAAKFMLQAWKQALKDSEN